ncbi:MAG: hypothetical protein HYY14_03390 [Candidatus Omnitrophica bacterium]|nr:hypothetical protein [Candidatus Omnitrophota bacterium]
MKITMGLELESYSIALPENRICRELHFPRRSSIEKGERFKRDASIGPEYNSRVFTTVREAFFLLKNGLRKYTVFRPPDRKDEWHAIFPVGGWIDRFAGSHIHLAVTGRRLDYQDAKRLAIQLHDHLPFLIVLTASSPVWRNKVTQISSNRLFRGSKKYCRVTSRGALYKNPFREMSYNRGGKRKPPTLEIRICDSSLPEHLVAALSVCRAVALRWLKRKRPHNRSTHPNYLKARERAMRQGVGARLVWTNHWIRVPRYVDLFFRKYEKELKEMDIPEDVLRVFKYLKKGFNQAELIRRAALLCRKRHRPTWQRRFAKKYAKAIKELLDGNSLEQFARGLGVRLPDIRHTWLGHKGARW